MRKYRDGKSSFDRAMVVSDGVAKGPEKASGLARVTEEMMIRDDVPNLSKPVSTKEGDYQPSESSVIAFNAAMDHIMAEVIKNQNLAELESMKISTLEGLGLG